MRKVCARISELNPSMPSHEDPVLHQSIYLEFEIKVKIEAWAELEGIIEVRRDCRTALEESLLTASIKYADSVAAPVQVFERMAGGLSCSAFINNSKRICDELT